MLRSAPTRVVVLVLAALVVTAWSGQAAHARTFEGRAAKTPPPQEILAAIGDRVVVLDGANDGRVVRTIATTPAGQRVGSVSATSDGQTVYFTVGEQCGPTPEVWRASAGHEPEAFIASGSDPLPSPDGRLLAYTAVSPSTMSGCVGYDTLVVRDLKTGTERRLVAGDQLSAVGPLAWSPNSKRLIAWRRAATLTIDVTGRRLRGAGQIDMPGNGYVFLPTGEAVTSLPTQSGTRVVTFDRRTGTERRTITEVAGQFALRDADPLAGGLLLFGPPAESTDGWDLYRADPPDPQPVKLASHVQSAVWMPRPPASLNRFVPPTRADGDVVVVPVTVLDGRRFALRYPARLAIAEAGFVTGAVLSTAVRSSPTVCCDRGIEVSYATVADAYGDTRPVATYLGADSQRVAYYASSPEPGQPTAGAVPIGALVFQFGPWLVEVDDRNPDDGVDAMSVAERTRLARGLQGSIDKRGFLVLDVPRPLVVRPNKREFGFGGNGTNSVSIGPQRLCRGGGTDTSARRSYLPLPPAEAALAWCDPATDLHVNVDGTQEFVEIAGKSLEIRARPNAPKGPRLAVCPRTIRVDETTSPDALPALESQTEDRAHAEAVLRANARRIRRDYEHITSLEIGPGGGYAWERASDGSIAVRQVDDYAIHVRLKGRGDCPRHGRLYASYNGIPLVFVAPA